MDTKLLLKKLQEIRDQLPEDVKKLVVISAGEGPADEEKPLDPKLQKVIDILKSLSQEERDLVLDKCDCTDGDNSTATS